MSLPELPEAERHDHGIHGRGYTEQQMREYGLLCRKQALEEAAALCESRITPGTGSVAILSGAADEIRSSI